MNKLAKIRLLHVFMVLQSFDLILFRVHSKSLFKETKILFTYSDTELTAGSSMKGTRSWYNLFPSSQAWGDIIACEKVIVIILQCLIGEKNVEALCNCGKDIILVLLHQKFMEHSDRCEITVISHFIHNRFINYWDQFDFHNSI